MPDNHIDDKLYRVVRKDGSHLSTKVNPDGSKSALQFTDNSNELSGPVDLVEVDEVVIPVIRDATTQLLEYDHCRRRYDLVFAEPAKIKNFMGTEEIFVYMLFLSSKPIEMEFQDKNGIVTCLPLGIFEKHIESKLISGEIDEVMCPVKKL